ncbi:MAG: cytochrome c3 family protein, partial [Nitrospiraceae bacterium]|nr:cytochrome c3 family protein [Nitrospiraceae bacterium]
SQYVVFAWNDLGMHCANPTYNSAVILPPYNTIWAQVVKRGNPPQVVTKGLTVQYRFINNTYSYGKGSFGQFWDNALKLFGITLAKNTGLNLVTPTLHNGLTGQMAAKSGHFEADGVPLTPLDDSGTWNPYQVAEITVLDSTGKTVAQTRTTAPVSDEINCSKCHGSNPFLDILQKHDANEGTNLVASRPVLCASCHGSPILATSGKGSSGEYLSQAIHGFHANKGAACYDCHPGQKTQCSRSIAHTAPDGNCTACHGDLYQVSSSVSSGARLPWVNEPKCVTCHNVAGVDTGSSLYRNSTGHGGMYCESCHGSPHAMVPSNQASDNYQAIQYQGKAKTIGSCGVCHDSSRGGGSISDFSETHAGPNPEHMTACNICHTAVSTDTSEWPHAYQWRNSNVTGSTNTTTSSGSSGSSDN